MDWKLFDLGTKGLTEFMDSPSWLILKFWEHKKIQERDRFNFSSMSAAKLSCLIESIANSFGGAKKAHLDLEDYLPFSLSEKHQKYPVSVQTAECFWSYVQKNKTEASEYVFQAFNDPDLMKVLKKGQKNG